MSWWNITCILGSRWTDEKGKLLFSCKCLVYWGQREQGGGNDCQRGDTSLPWWVIHFLCFLSSPAVGCCCCSPACCSTGMLFSGVALLRSSLPQADCRVLGRTDTPWHRQIVPDLGTGWEVFMRLRSREKHTPGAASAARAMSWGVPLPPASLCVCF